MPTSDDAATADDAPGIVLALLQTSASMGRGTKKQKEAKKKEKTEKE